MLKRIEGYWMEIIASNGAFLRLTIDPLPRGTNIYASISLSTVGNYPGFEADRPYERAEFAAAAFVQTWTVYKPDGTESEPQFDPQVLKRDRNIFTQNTLMIENCARITFALYGIQVNAIAQINIFAL